jgi:hypothetical protein
LGGMATSLECALRLTSGHSSKTSQEMLKQSSILVGQQERNLAKLLMIQSSGQMTMLCDLPLGHTLLSCLHKRYRFDVVFAPLGYTLQCKVV